MTPFFFVVYRYGPLGVADVLYAKVRKGHRTEWIRDRGKASIFKKDKAQAFAKGFRAVRGEDLVIEPR